MQVSGFDRPDVLRWVEPVVPQGQYSRIGRFVFLGRGYKVVDMDTLVRSVMENQKVIGSGKAIKGCLSSSVNVRERQVNALCLSRSCCHGLNLKERENFSRLMNQFQSAAEEIHWLTVEVRKQGLKEGKNFEEIDREVEAIFKQMEQVVVTTYRKELQKIGESQESIRRLNLHTSSILAMFEVAKLFTGKLPFHQLQHTIGVGIGAAAIHQKVGGADADPSLALFAGMTHDIRMGYDSTTVFLRKAGEAPDCSEGGSIIRAGKIYESLTGKRMEGKDWKFIKGAVEGTIPSFDSEKGCVVNRIDGKGALLNGVPLADLAACHELEWLENGGGKREGWIQEAPAIWVEMKGENADKMKRMYHLLKLKKTSEKDREELNTLAREYAQFLSNQLSFLEGRSQELQEYMDGPIRSDEKQALQEIFCDSSGRVKRDGGVPIEKLLRDLGCIKDKSGKYSTESLDLFPRPKGLREGLVGLFISSTRPRCFARHIVGSLDNRCGGMIPSEAEQRAFEERMRRLLRGAENP